MPSCRGSSHPRDGTQDLCLLNWQAGSLPSATWEAQQMVRDMYITHYMYLDLSYDFGMKYQ